MTSLVTNQTHIGCLVANVVLGKHAKPFQMEVERFLTDNGPEWTVNRQKAIWTAATHLRNGDRDAAQSVYRQNSIAYHKSDMTPKGASRRVVRGFVEASRPSVIRRYAAVLRFYTTLVLPDLSEKQGTKALNAITAPQKGAVSDELSDYFSRAGRFLSGLTSVGVNRGSSDPRDLSVNTYQFSEEKLTRSDRATPLRQMAYSLMTEGYIPEGLGFTDPFPSLTAEVRAFRPNQHYAGKIGIIQEQGAKARVMAMPTTRLQLAFKPLENYLDRVDRNLGTSVMRDQVQAIHGLVNHMEHHDAYSTDLRSATDRFPRSLTLDMLRGMGAVEWAVAFEEVSSMNWSSPWGDIAYSVGQPQGLISSFVAFHLSNQVLASYAERLVTNTVDLSFEGRSLSPSTFQVLLKNGEQGLDGGPLVRFPNESTFYVLGDDIVFSDGRVRDAYASVLDEIGVEISHEKSFSGQLTEFAGFVVTKAKGKPFSFRPYKPPSGQRISNPVDLLAALGVRAKAINPYWARQASLFERTWGDRSPDLTPWVNQESDPVRSRWDLAALENEFQLLSQKYPSTVPHLSQHVRYTENKLISAPGWSLIRGGEPEGVLKNTPKVEVETNREALGQEPKHPRRRPSPLHADPLMRRERERAGAEPLSEVLPKGSNPMEGTTPAGPHPERELDPVTEVSTSKAKPVIKSRDPGLLDKDRHQSYDWEHSPDR